MSETKNTGLSLVKANVHRRKFLTAALAGAAAAVTPQLLKASPLRALPRESELPADLVQELFDKFLQGELGEFAISLEIARAIWRRYPEMVEAPEFPAHLRPAYIAEWGNEPDDDCSISGSPFVTKEVVAKAHADAIEVASIRVATGRAS